MKYDRITYFDPFNTAPLGGIKNHRLDSTSSPFRYVNWDDYESWLENHNTRVLGEMTYKSKLIIAGHGLEGNDYISSANNDTQINVDQLATFIKSNIVGASVVPRAEGVATRRLTVQLSVCYSSAGQLSFAKMLYDSLSNNFTGNSIDVNVIGYDTPVGQTSISKFKYRGDKFIVSGGIKINRTNQPDATERDHNKVFKIFYKKTFNREFPEGSYQSMSIASGECASAVLEELRTDISRDEWGNKGRGFFMKRNKVPSGIEQLRNTLQNEEIIDHGRSIVLARACNDIIENRLRIVMGRRLAYTTAFYEKYRDVFRLIGIGNNPIGRQ